MKSNIKKPDLRNIKLKNINVIQFVPLIFVISLVANSVFGYTAPKSNPMSKTPATEVSADSKKETKKKAKKASMGELDLSKIKDGTYEGSGTGFRGTVKVSVTVKDHKITDIKVVSSQDDATFFNRAKSGIIASIIKEQSLNVDVVSGATYSSKGILAAVKNALTGEEDNSTAAGANAASAGGAGTAGKLADAEESGTYKDGTYQGTGTGFRGTIKVSVTIKDSKIKGIKVLSKHDDPAYFNRAKSGVLAAIVKKQTTNVDTVSGATYSSNGLISAVRNALKKAAVNKTTDDTKDDNNNKKDDSDKNTDTGATLTGDYKEGTFKGTGTGFRGDTTVSVTIKKDRMTNIKVLKKHDDEPFFTNAKAVIKLMLAGQKYDVDTISGATYSSKGIIAAVKDALSKAEITNKKPDSDDTDKDDDKKDDNNNNDNNNSDDNKDPSTEEPKEDLVSGTFSGSATCYPDDDNDFSAYTLSLNVVVKDGKVTEIKDIKGAGNGYIAINDSFIRSAKNGVLPQLLKGNTSCDAVSGATCSSKAIIAAYKDAMSKVK